MKPHSSPEGVGDRITAQFSASSPCFNNLLPYTLNVGKRFLDSSPLYSFTYAVPSGWGILFLQLHVTKLMLPVFRYQLKNSSRWSIWKLPLVSDIYSLAVSAENSILTFCYSYTRGIFFPLKIWTWWRKRSGELRFLSLILKGKSLYYNKETTHSI